LHSFVQPEVLSAVDPERCRSVGDRHSATRPHLDSSLLSLHWFPVW